MRTKIDLREMGVIWTDIYCEYFTGTSAAPQAMERYLDAIEIILTSNGIGWPI